MSYVVGGKDLLNLSFLTKVKEVTTWSGSEGELWRNLAGVLRKMVNWIVPHLMWTGYKWTFWIRRKLRSACWPCCPRVFYS